MDPRRFLTLTAAFGLFAGCATLDELADTPLPSIDAPGPTAPESHGLEVGQASLPQTARPYLEADKAAETTAVLGPAESVAPPARTGRAAIAAANAEARAASRSDQFVGGVQVFAWAPGRVYEVWAAPLRVTTLTLGPGETVQSKAAGDTVRWQIGETTSGAGARARTHILLKPLERGLETNLVLTTSHRVYLLDLRSGSAEAFNAAIAWDTVPGDAAPAGPEPVFQTVETAVVGPQGPLDSGYRIRPRGRAPRWTPTAVFNDGVRTFITFAPGVWTDEVPALFVIAPDGEAQLVNYRQEGGLFVVDRVFDQAELRLGSDRPKVVRLQRLAGGQS